MHTMMESFESRVLMSAGNVEFEWKVEEGESSTAPPTLTADAGTTSSRAGGGGGAGKVQMQDFHFVIR